MQDSVQLIFNYFPNLSEVQQQQFTALLKIYEEWNQKINVISRKDMEHFYERHVLHCLSIAKFITISKGEILDIGTGGGFPGIPLAILFPETKFTLVDSIGKKIKVVEAVIQELKLPNVKAFNVRAESLTQTFDFSVSRATASITDLVKWSFPLLQKGNQNGLIALKGGDLTEELQPFRKHIKIINIAGYFKEEFFETKKIIYLKKTDN